MKRKKNIILFMVLPMLLLNGCWSSNELNALAINVCIGIDKSGDEYRLTKQVINPKSIASQKGTDESPIVIYSETGKDLSEIRHRISMSCPREIYNSHLRVVLLGEDVAKEGIEDILSLFARDHEFRTDFVFIIAKGTTAESVMSILTPLETISAIEMYDSLKVSEKSWAPTKSIKIIELINSIIPEGVNPVLSGVELTESKIDSDTTDALKYSSESSRIKFTSLGAFKEDKLIGWLNEDESKGYNYILGNVKTTVGYVDYGEDVRVSSKVLSAKSKIKPSMENGKPTINIEVDIKAEIESVIGEFDISKKENKEIFEKLANQKVKSLCEQSIKKAKELGTDIYGFGEEIHRKYPEQWKDMKDDWNKLFQKLPVNISVNVEIKQLGQIGKPLFLKEE